ncbi:hypothetical protein CFC21_020740 [Triticum aestivum]|uniref:DUF1618 domain-containing protein n=3 Tax=Triticum TaxID=4564 RepID=A0A9R1RFY4_TRITD|nr:uncharacterized protein LOC123043126 [Triticum aestivum]KAF7005630.1 hypothetical protein CFC21_020740 [Triticum aestivum]VAH40083.1 unnamed protein product [Triticum turgidum subsp. durum]
MARSMVLLDREIDFTPHDEALSGRQFRWGFWEGRGLQTREARSDEVIKYLRTFKARAVVDNPPELSFLHILVPPQSLPLPPPFMDLDSGRISSTDKNLVALYAGGYRPGSSLSGGYLIYDARKDSLSVIPRLPSDDLHGVMGHQSAVVMCDAQGEGYVLAELIKKGFSQAGVWLWKSSAPQPEWVSLPGSHPLPSSRFTVDLCFSYRGSTLCWVDLLKGMFLCDLNQDCDNKFSFIKLPLDCPALDCNLEESSFINKFCTRPEEFRSMACVCDHIKLVSLDESGLELSVWTLLTDHSDWIETSKYNVDKIWANVNYQSTVLRQLIPSLPVLSIHEDGVVYLVVNDESIVDHRLDHKGQYLLRVDMKSNEIQISPQPTRRICYQLFASEFSAYRQHLQD